MFHLRKLFQEFSLAVVILLLGEAIALASYKPPQPPTPTKVTGTTTGVRGGCYGDAETDLTAIAPISHVGQSSSQYPSFVWFVPGQENLPMEFRLYELETGNASNTSKTTARKKRILVQNFDSQAGWMKFDLPSTTGPLSANKDYLWSVILHCNPNRPSRSQRINAELKIQPIDVALQTQIELISEVNIRARLLAEQGYWYDAIQLLMPSVSAEEIGTVSRNTRTELLTALAQLEPEPRQRQLMEILRTQP